MSKCKSLFFLDKRSEIMLRLVLFNLWISSHRELPKKIVEKKEVTPAYTSISQQIYSKKND